MRFETVKPTKSFSKDEEKKFTKSRYQSDAELMEVDDNLNLAISEKQVNTARQMMEKEKGRYMDRVTINGKEISVGWDMFSDEYTLFFPQLNDSDDARESGIFQPMIRIGKDSENAKKAFVYAGQEARSEDDIHQLYKRVEDFIYNLSEDGKV